MSEQRDYRDTVFLPKTDFPMKAGLPQKEPGILARWQAEDIYGQTRAAREGREKFILHDGPPYANGDMHIGHALNHILKDMVVRTHTLLGYDAPYVPGWDCHGLPIEWKVEEEYRKKKLDKDQVDPVEFRAECRAYAQHWVDTQREQLKRLGVNADWDHPYLTMDFAAESIIVSELLKFAESGQLYRGAKPVMWSPVEKTALAEAEVEYEDIVSTQIDVAFEIVESPIPELIGAHAVIWTTTPWTIPTNQAIAYGADVEYVVLEPEIGFGGFDSGTFRNRFGELRNQFAHLFERKFLVAEPLLAAFQQRVEADASKLLKILGGDNVELLPDREPVLSLPGGQYVLQGYGDRIKGSDLAGTKVRHPMAAAFPDSDFYTRLRPMLDGSAFVTTESGTGLVHMAPDHGEDDFDLCKANGIEPVFAVGADGVYRDDWPWLGADDERRRAVINPNFNAPDGPICSDLREAGALLSASTDYRHSYPHSWRSKKKVIFRCTPQWFVPMDKPLASPDDIALCDHEVQARAENEALRSVRAEPVGAPSCSSDGSQGESAALRQAQGERTLRQTALQAIADTRFVPAKGRNRIGAMVEGRPDWVLSRQRAWGVPITLFVDRKSGQYLNDPAVNARIIAAVREGGVDAWSDARAQEYLGDAYSAEDYDRVTDILDVWFDSGSTHAFVLESGKWPDLLRPAGYSGPPADLYLEGSDQHRGWFQSSLLESCGTRGHAPYKAVLTHGFTMDAKGEKMSKSKGNTVSPLKVMEQYGADIIRLWALSVDYTEDHRIGDEILKGVADQYRKIRNTFRYLLGALDGFEYDVEGVDLAQLPELERYVLALLGKLDAALRRAVADFDFNTYTREIADFCNEDLSAFFFDIRKDRLYCDAPASIERRAYRTVLDVLFQALVRYAAPVLVFTAEEVWGTRFPDRGSVHLQEWHPLPAEWADEALVSRYAALRDLRERVNEAIEPLRREKTVRSSLEAEVTLGADVAAGSFTGAQLEELFITASVTLGHGDGVRVSPTSHHKCGRCWRHLPDVAEDGTLCGRCAEAIGEEQPAGAAGA